MLNAHSQIHWGGEIFNPYMKTKQTDNNLDFVKEILHRNQQQKISRILGFETKYLPQQHLCRRCINMDLADYLNLLRHLRYSKFIVLHRKNYLRRAVSVQVGRETHQWHSRQKASAPVKVAIDIHSFKTGIDQGPLLDLFRCLDENYHHLTQLLSHNDALFLTYEDDILEDPQSAYRKVCNFIDVSDEAPDVVFYRTNPFKYEEIILNFDEIKTTLKGTQYSWMLDD